MKKTYGNLIVVDGLDGAGKTSAFAVIKEYLSEHFPDMELVLGEGAIFSDYHKDLKALMHKHKSQVSHNTLYNLWRSMWVDAWEKHGQGVFERTKMVLSDRWLLTTGVYQDTDNTRSDHLIESCNAIPGLTFLLTVSKDVAIKRITNYRPLDDFEIDYFQRHDKLKQDFIDKTKVYCSDTVIIDTDNLTQEEVAEIIRNKLKEYFRHG